MTNVLLTLTLLENQTSLVSSGSIHIKTGRAFVASLTASCHLSSQRVFSLLSVLCLKVRADVRPDVRLIREDLMSTTCD